MFSRPAVRHQKVACNFHSSQDWTRTPADISRSLLRVLVRTVSQPKEANKMWKKRTKEGYSQSCYFPVHSLGTTPSFPCMHKSPLRSSPSTLIACFYTTNLNTAVPRWYSKRFSSSAEVAAASWPSKEEVVAAPSFPLPSPRSCSETSWASARNCDRSRSPCRSPRCLRPQTHSRRSRCLSTAWSAG